MTKFRLISYAISVLLLASCAGGRTSDTQADVANDAKMLCVVPSDALAVIHSEKSSIALEILDTLNTLRRLDLGKLANKTCALSWSYIGTLSPLVAIEAGRDEEDSVFVCGSIIPQAEELKLHTHYIPKAQSPVKEAVLLLSKSEALLASCLRHISEERSILDADNFSDAAAQVGDSRNFLLFSGKIAQRILPQSGVAGYSKSQISRFTDATADWFAVGRSLQELNIKPYYSYAATSFAAMIESLTPSKSELYNVLPDTTHFAISLPIKVGEFRQAREKYLDATVKLTAYKKNIDTLRIRTGKNPLSWEQEIDVQEVAIAKWENHEILLVRSKKAGNNSEIVANPYPGYIPLLYGDAFKISNESYFATFTDWHLFGSKDALDSFINYQDRILNLEGHDKKCNLSVLYSDNMLSWDKNEISLWNLNQ